MLKSGDCLDFKKLFCTFALSNNEGYSSNNKQFKIMESVVANAWVETYQNFMNLVYNGLDTHEKVSSYLHQMNLFATEARTLLHKGFLKPSEEKNALVVFVECFLVEMTMFEDNDLPSESPFSISEQELKNNYEVIFDSIRDISRGFCTMLSEIDSFRFELKLYEPSVMEELFKMKKFSIVDRALILEIDELED